MDSIIPYDNSKTPAQWVDEVYNALLSHRGTGVMEVEVPGGRVGVKSYYFSMEYYYIGPDEHGHPVIIRDNDWKTIREILYTLWKKL